MDPARELPNRLVRPGNIELALYAWGNAALDRPAVVLVHGYPDSAGVWQATAEHLAQHYRVFAYDVRGAGRSSHPPRTADYALTHLVEDLAAVVDAVSPDAPVHLIGHDWGSIQSWEAVTTERMRGRIASFTSISGPSLDHAGHWIRRRLKSGSPEKLAQLARQFAHSWYIGAFHLPGLAPAAWKFGGGRLWPGFLKKTEGIAVESSATQARDGTAGIKLYRANFARHVLRPQARHTEVPVQVIVPKRDRFMVREIWDDLPQWVGRLWRREIDAGHWLPLSHPQLLATWAGEFITHIEGDEETAGLRRARLDGPRKRHSGKLAIVTGAGSGIGRETLLALAEQGAEVVAADIDRAAAERSVELAELLGARAHAYPIDVGNAEAMEGFAAWAADQLGAPDIVVNNAGIGMAGRFVDTSAADWEKILHVNLWGVIHGSRLFARQMLAAGKAGCIVNVASALAFAPSRMLPAYSASKAAVVALSDSLRAELAEHRIRVVSVCPGVVNTPITERTHFVGVGEAEQTRRREGARRLYQRRNLKPQVVACAILAAIAGDQPEVLVGAEAHAARWLGRLSPALLRRLARLDLAL